MCFALQLLQGGMEPVTLHQSVQQKGKQTHTDNIFSNYIYLWWRNIQIINGCLKNESMNSNNFVDGLFSMRYPGPNL